jgi:histone acetyltransferase SAS3
VPRIARDLLPAQRGVDPGGHSIFKELILPDGEGARSLRKRKASHEEEVQPPVRTTRKKRRPSENSKSSPTAASAGAASPPVPARSTRSVKSVATDGHDTEGDAHHTASDGEETRQRPSRARRPKQQPKVPQKLAWIDREDSQDGRLMLILRLNNAKVQNIVTSKPKKKTSSLTEEEKKAIKRDKERIRRERKKLEAQQERGSPEEVAPYPVVQHHYAPPFQGFSEKEDENKSKPYGGVLSEADADTSKTYPTQADRKRFDDARAKAEQEWKEKQEALYSGLEPSRQSKQATTASKIKCVNFGGWEIDTWHAAPYPEEYSKNRVLYICEFCLKYMNSDYVAWRHKVRAFWSMHKLY